jgi:Zn-dependent alcohol dehydrogenase
VVIVGDGAVGLMGVLATKQMGAGRISAMSRHKTRQDLALEFGATDIIAERGDAGVARIKDLAHGIGADAVLEPALTAPPTERDNRKRNMRRHQPRPSLPARAAPTLHRPRTKDPKLRA